MLLLIWWPCEREYFYLNGITIERDDHKVVELQFANFSAQTSDLKFQIKPISHFAQLQSAVRWTPSCPHFIVQKQLFTVSEEKPNKDSVTELGNLKELVNF